MSAEVLRKAATLMRERAEVWEYHNGPWYTTPGPAGWTCIRAATQDEDYGEADTFVFQMDTSSTATHIASWHPAVALAVADWLDREAELSETLQKHGARGVTGVREHPALAVARAYLGEPEPPTVA